MCYRRACWWARGWRCRGGCRLPSPPSSSPTGKQIHNVILAGSLSYKWRKGRRAYTKVYLVNFSFHSPWWCISSFILNIILTFLACYFKTVDSYISALVHHFLRLVVTSSKPIFPSHCAAQVLGVQRPLLYRPSLCPITELIVSKMYIVKEVYHDKLTDVSLHEEEEVEQDGGQDGSEHRPDCQQNKWFTSASYSTLLICLSF